jgi:hypothetical protein
MGYTFSSNRANCLTYGVKLVMNLLDEDYSGSNIILSSTDPDQIMLEIFKNIPFEGTLYLAGYSANGESLAHIPLYVKVCGDE